MLYMDERRNTNIEPAFVFSFQDAAAERFCTSSSRFDQKK